MTRSELIRDFIQKDLVTYGGVHDPDIDRYDMIICKRCIDALHSRGAKVMVTDESIIDGYDLQEFIAYGGLDAADDGNDPTGCEWCEEVDDLYGVIFR